MLNFFEQFRRDLRFGIRGLIRTPGSSALAILSLALGIMATTAIYSVLHAVVLDPFPYKDVDTLMSVRVGSPEQRFGRTGYSVDQFLEISERSRIFEGVIASTISDVLWTEAGDPQRLRGNHGTFNTFEVMGVPPLIGRTPTADDARPGAPPVVVLGYRFWQRQFNGDPGVLGREMRLNDVVRTVIGVMPKRFMWRGADVYLPVAFQRGQTVEGVRNVHLLGRLNPGVGGAEAEADLAPIITDLKSREPSLFPDRWRVSLLPFEETFPSAIAGDVWILLGAVSLLLLIACANVSNLLLTRASVRQREMTIRVALGASRRRLVRQLLTESLILALAGGALGTGLAYAGLPALLAIVPPGTIPDESEIRLNLQVLGFALLVSALTSVICGLAPALQTVSRDLAGSMREASRSLSGSSRQAIVRKSLVVLEVALALMLLAGSSLLLRTFVALERAQVSVPPEELLTMRVPLPAQRYPDSARRVAFFQELLPRIQSVPGVVAVGLNSGLHPLGNLRAPAEVAGEPSSNEPVVIHNVSAGYLDAVGIRLAAGRTITDSDVDGARHVALVNDQFVRTRFNGRPPLGHVIRVPRLREPPVGLQDDAFQVVGVVHNTLNVGLSDPIAPELYLPFTLSGLSNIVVVRTAGDPASVTRPVIAQVYAVDKGQPVTSVQTLETLLKETEYATPRFNLVLLSIFAAVGMALTVIGVYGVMSSAVAQERQEIGIRMAMGADAGTISRMVIARGARLLVAGTAFGLLGSVIAGRWLAGEVWRVAAFDPAAFAAVSVLLVLVGLQACYWPARRASRTDPLIALRQQD